MAQDVQIPGAGSTARIRNPIAVAIFSVITLGIYVLYWWYSANREMVDYGKAKATDELGDSPTEVAARGVPGRPDHRPGALDDGYHLPARAEGAEARRSDADQRLARVRPLHRVLARVHRVHAERAEQRVGDAVRLARRRAARRPAERGPAKQQTAADEADAEEHDEPERRSGEGQRGTARRGAEDRTPLLVRGLRDAARSRRGRDHPRPGRALRGRWSSVRPRRRPQSGPGVGRRDRTESRSGELAPKSEGTQHDPLRPPLRTCRRGRRRAPVQRGRRP